MRSYCIVMAVLSLIVLTSTRSRAEIGIWISSAEIANFPTSGSLWDNLKAEADQATGTPNLSNQDDPVNVRVLAKAIVYARTQQENYRQDVISAVNAAMGTEAGARALALGREIAAYVIAADLVGLPPADDATFRSWLSGVRTYPTTGGPASLIESHEDRPNNWGTHAGGSRIAIAAYLNDTQEIARCAQVFKGWLGDRNSYANFSYGDLSWQSDQSNPVGINPQGATIQGQDVDGVLPDDQRRAGSFSWPPTKENYVYEALQGVLAQAVILSRLGNDVWNWENQAILRAYQWLYTNHFKVQINDSTFLYDQSFPAEGDDRWQLPLIDYFYGTNFWDGSPTSGGKNLGWTCWTHQAKPVSIVRIKKIENSPELNLFPNPFHSVLTLNYTVDEPGVMQLDVFNLDGKIVETVRSTQNGRGTYSIQWLPDHLPAGQYLVNFKLDKKTRSKLVGLVK